MSNRSGTSNRSDTLTTFHFFVTGQTPDDAISQAIFTEVSGLDIEIEVTPYEEGGVNDHVHKLLGRAKVSDITLRNGVTNSTALWDWYRDTLRGIFKRKTVTIAMVDQAGEERHRWTFLGALPVKWTGPQLKADQGTNAIQSLQLTHQGLHIEESR